MTVLEEIKRCNDRLKELISEEIDEQSLMNILDKRTAVMSKKREHQAERDVLSDVIVSRRGDMKIGIPVTAIREVRKNYSVPLAHGNDIIIGLFQSRGQIHTLVDILPLVGYETTGQTSLDGLYIMHLSLESRDIGVVADELVGSRVIYRDEAARGHNDEENGIVKAITKDLVSIIDVKSLFSSSRIILNHGAIPKV